MVGKLQMNPVPGIIISLLASCELPPNAPETYRGRHVEIASQMAGAFAMLCNPVELKVQSLGIEVIRKDKGRHILQKVTAHAGENAHRRDIKVLGYPCTNIQYPMVFLGVSPREEHTNSIEQHRRESRVQGCEGRRR